MTNPLIPYNELRPLPPPDELWSTVEVWKRESSARAALAELRGLANIIPNQEILINAIVLQEARDSSEIENIITTQDKLYRSLSAESEETDPHTKEVINYREALYDGFEKIKETGVLSLSNIIWLQQVIAGMNPGLRSQPGTVLTDKTGKTVYIPPDNPKLIRDLMDNLMEYYNGKDHSLVHMAICHYQFEAIHPFSDGNGRTGRLLNVLYLILKGYLDIPILYLSTAIIKSKPEYYRLLAEVTSKGGWIPWIRFILQCVEETSRDTISRIKAIKELLERTIETVRENAKGIYSRELVELLFENPYSKIEFLVDRIGVERKAASRYLKKLDEIGILSMVKIGRENIYINKGLMELLK
jgi:Fic family protein